MRWIDTDITVHRSETHSKTWVANVPGTEVFTYIASAGPLRACQAWVLTRAAAYGPPEAEDASGYRWVRDDPDTYHLEAQVP